MRQARNGGERKNNTVPIAPVAAANSTAAAGEAVATNSATIIGPTMKISSISTDSSEYAVPRRVSSARRRLKYARMQTVIGGNAAPAAAADARIKTGWLRASTAATRETSAAGNAMLHASSVLRGPVRSMRRLSAGATTASPIT